MIGYTPHELDLRAAAAAAPLRPDFAAGFESLAASWAKHVTFASGMRTGANISDIAAAYAAQAKDWRLRFGTPNQHVVGSHRVTREDAYSTDLDNVSRDFPGP